MHSNLLLRKPTDSKLYVEDVFSTYLYTGNSSTQTITNGVDLANNGGLIWFKNRDAPNSFQNHNLIDSARGLSSGSLRTNLTNAQTGTSSDVTSFNSNGFSLGYVSAAMNDSPQRYASWTFRKAPKFFDVVTWTGDGVTGRQISHNLGVAPGMVIVKCTSSTPDWVVSHRSLTAPDYELSLNQTRGQQQNGIFGAAGHTSTYIQLGLYNQSYVNSNGATYVAYLFAHDTTADGLIQCGSFTNSSNTVNLGWEPQYVLIKRTDGASGWLVFDNMRGMPASGTSDQYLEANTSNAEANGGGTLNISSTGFTAYVGGFVNWVYMAIRRGPMRVPTDATKVYSVVAQNGQGTVTTGFPVDASLFCLRPYGGVEAHTRLQGSDKFLRTDQTNAEYTATGEWDIDSNTGFAEQRQSASQSAIYWNLRRAPGFFDVVCYTGTGSARTVNHNLGVAPELMIVKSRSNSYNWWVYSASTGNNAYLIFNTNDLVTNSAPGAWNQTSPTASVFSLGTYAGFNASGYTYVAYLFATCPGVSKVGSYTGTGTTLQINCGFTNGARFVLIKRTDSTGDWTVWDTARGIVSGNDPYLLLNSTAAEVTNTDYIDPLSTGFEISSTAPAAINANGGTFVFLAIA